MGFTAFHSVVQVSTAVSTKTAFCPLGRIIGFHAVAGKSDIVALYGEVGATGPLSAHAAVTNAYLQ